jgi:predicted metal-dependent enzyme (double-stranded beta helix superfamily)
MSVWSELVRLCDAFVEEHPVVSDVETVGTLMRRLEPHLKALRMNAEELPYGRYLLHGDEQGRYNIQLDVFSMDYEGSIHSHDTWGLMWVLKGSLYISNWNKQESGFQMLCDMITTAGSGNCFCPPISDWHKVITPKDGPQPVSLHFYGPGFDLDEGTYVNSDFEVVQGRRSPFKSNEVFLPHLTSELV